MNQSKEEKKLSPEEIKDAEANKMVAALSYIWILCLVPLFLKRDSKFAQFHAKQGLMLFVVEIVGGLVFWIPLFGWALAMALFLLSIYSIVQVLEGKYWEIPTIGEYAKKINL